MVDKFDVVIRGNNFSMSRSKTARVLLSCGSMPQAESAGAPTAGERSGSRYSNQQIRMFLAELRIAYLDDQRNENLTGTVLGVALSKKCVWCLYSRCEFLHACYVELCCFHVWSRVASMQKFVVEMWYEPHV